jgi:hypothetical protein
MVLNAFRDNMIWLSLRWKLIGNIFFGSALDITLLPGENEAHTRLALLSCMSHRISVRLCEITQIHNLANIEPERFDEIEISLRNIVALMDSD